MNNMNSFTLPLASGYLPSSFFSRTRIKKCFVFFFLIGVLHPFYVCFNKNTSFSSHGSLLVVPRKISSGSTIVKSGIGRRSLQDGVVGKQQQQQQQQPQQQQQDDISFLVMSDTHLFTSFSYFGGDRVKELGVWDSSVEVLSYIKEQYGGELVMMPGDSVSYGGQSNDEIKEKLNATVEMSMNEVIYTAGYNCYTTVRQLYSAVGYDTILVAVGDHELGGNRGFRTGKRFSKVSTISSYRQAVADGYNKDADLNFLYKEKIGLAESRPLGTIFEETSYAYRYKNSLFITIDAFKEAIDNQTNYIDRVNGLGGEGTITGDVDGPHLD
jgi:hypothetical protein